LADSARDRGLDLLPDAAWSTVRLPRLEGESLFLTGATGFVGRWVLAAIARLNARLKKPLRVTALSRGERPVEAPWLKWVSGDVRTLEVASLPAANLILHAALSSSATPPGGDAELMKTAVGGMSRVNSYATVHRARRMVVLSSGSVYGTAYGPLNEESPLAELETGDTYGRAKREVEQLAFSPSHAGRTEVVVARLFTCIGHGYRKHGHLAHVSMIDDARSGKPIVLRSDGSAIRSYLFGADLAVWLLAILSAEGSEVVNVGSDAGVSMLEFAKTVARVAGRGADAVVVKATDPVVRPVFVPDISRARSIFGVAPWTNVEAAIAQMLSAA
jgi:nucleoside-diphosphate-sugar epimerase